MKSTVVTKYLLASLSIYAAIICLAFRFIQFPDPMIVEFGGEKWHIPSTVGEMDKIHHFDFVSPAYYSKKYPNGMEVILSTNRQRGDVSNETQAKEVLFDRTLNGYIFRFPSNQETYDSLRTLLERKYNGKFVLTKGDKYNPSNVPLSEQQKRFEFDFLTVNEKLTIGIHKSQTLVVVRFMYDLPVEVMGVKMGSFLNK